MQRVDIKNKDKIILDLAGGTGAWSKPYRDAGYTVINVTLPEYDVRTYIPPENVYGILAAPPCTQFSLARTIAKTPRDLKLGMEMVIACFCVIWECRYKNKLKFWALENPRGILRQFLGKPAFTFYQWEFGKLGIKPTDIWGYFNIPKKIVRIKPEYMNVKYPSGKKNTIGWGKMTKEMRAITPSGFANSFFKANR